MPSSMAEPSTDHGSSGVDPHLLTPRQGTSPWGTLNPLVQPRPRGFSGDIPRGGPPSGAYLCVREPRWTGGSYAQSPALRQLDGDGPWRGSASIECWRGTADELLEPIRTLGELVGADAEHTVLSVALANGQTLMPSSFDDLHRVITDASDEVLAVRAEMHGDEARGVLVARQHLPGLIVQVDDPDRERGLGRTETVFRRMMIGYVDRMGGARGLAWMGSAIAPLLLAGMAVAPGDAPVGARVAVIVGAAAAAAAIFVVSYDRLLVSQPLDVRRELPLSSQQCLGEGTKRFLAHPWTSRCLRVLGALVIGAAGSKLAEILPFP